MNYTPKYFTNKEILCPCGCGARPSDEALIALDNIRSEYGNPIYLEQGATCRDYSVNVVGRSSTSEHIELSDHKPTAFDIKKKTFRSKEDWLVFISIAIKYGFHSIGFGSYWVGAGNNTNTHIDMRSGKTWMYA